MGKFSFHAYDRDNRSVASGTVTASSEGEATNTASESLANGDRPFYSLQVEEESGR
ncbi:hypothetical protein AB0G85_35095 [Streptomyces sioyaensis]|uniref:hypothetical protein n=1 Tax=Streptomyces sioyaensis TaxID=67364 RepID=UPI0033EAE56D